jgi:hypothetical protein
MVNYLVILFRCHEKSLGLRWSSSIFSSNNVPKLVVYLGVYNEKAPDAHVNNIVSSNTVADMTFHLPEILIQAS